MTVVLTGYHTSCPLPAGADQICFLQDRKVMRHGRFGHREVLSQLPGGHFAVSK
jgi:hypothetical protein